MTSIEAAASEAVTRQVIASFMADEYGWKPDAWRYHLRRYVTGVTLVFFGTSLLGRIEGDTFTVTADWVKPQ